MTNMWVYEGELDASGKVLTLNTTGPAFDGSGKTANYQDVITVKDADNRTLTSRVHGDDGEWTDFMSARAHDQQPDHSGAAGGLVPAREPRLGLRRVGRNEARRPR